MKYIPKEIPEWKQKQDRNKVLLISGLLIMVICLIASNFDKIKELFQ